MTAGTTTAFAACEALFTAHPGAVTGEGDSGQVMPVVIAGQRLRLVRHDTAMGRFYRLYQPDDDIAILTVAVDNDVSMEITAQLAAAVPDRAAS
jgi:hypothetical protein